MPEGHELQDKVGQAELLRVLIYFAGRCLISKNPGFPSTQNLGEFHLASFLKWTNYFSSRIKKIILQNKHKATNKRRRRRRKGI